MAVKLATLVALFSLVLSAAAFASVSDHQDKAGGTEAIADSEAGEVMDRDLRLERGEGIEEVELYLGPLNEIFAETPALNRVY